MKKNDDRAFEGLVAFILGITVSVFTIAYKVYVIMRFVSWFNVPIELSFRQWYGLISIIGLISYTWVKTDDEGKSIWYKIFNPIFLSVFMSTFCLIIYYAISRFI